MTDFAWWDEKRCRNLAHNLAAVRERLQYPIYDGSETATLVCYGPSLRDTLSEIDPGTQIFSVSAAHDLLLERGFIPIAHIEFDSRAHKAKHVRCVSPLRSRSTLYMLASCVHPDMITVLKGRDIVLWHARQGGKHDAMIEANEPDAQFIEGGSSVGLRAIELLYACGYRSFDIHGMDSSFRDNGRDQWAGKHFGNSAEKRDVVDVAMFGRRFKTSVAFLTYARQFFSCRAKLKDATFTLRGDGLLQHMAASLPKEKAA